MILPPDPKPPRMVPRGPKSANRPPRDVVDLHCHSTLSDGQYDVETLLDKAAERQLRALAITDHDNLDSYAIGKDLARERGIELIPGIEISAVHEGRDIHVLGYCFDPTNLSLNLELKEQHRRRKERIRAILKKLAGLGVELTFEKVQSFSRGGVLGRPHVAQALMAEEYVSSFSEAFQKYLGDEGAAFVEKRGLSVEEAIRLIHRAGGIAVLAHPLRTGVDDLLDKLPDWGLGGMEIVTGLKKASAVRKLRDWAVDRGMACTGGSDYRGDQSPCGLGTLSIPYRALDDLRDKLEIQKTEWI